jgi:hypothetical protein
MSSASETDNAMTPIRHRRSIRECLLRCLRFRLRTLLVLLTLASIWLAMHVNAARRQQKAVAAIREYGGWMRYDFQFPSGEFSHQDFDQKAGSPVPAWLLQRFGIDMFHDVVQVSLNYSEDSGKREENGNQTDKAIVWLPDFPKLRVLLLQGNQIRDESMAHLAALRYLECLMMWDAHGISDNGIVHLQDLEHLKYIHLSESKITDRSLEIFSRMPQLEGLSLQFNDFSDAGVSKLSDMRNLTALWVCGAKGHRNRITDASLDLLSQLPKLTSLGVQNTDVTASGVDKFKRELPGRQVYSDTD